MSDPDTKEPELAREVERLRKQLAELESRRPEDRPGEKELSASLLRQGAILDNIPDIAWLKDREGRFIAVNGPFGEACGMAPAELVGRTDYDIWPRDLAESYRAADAEVMRTGKRKRVEERLVGPGGRERWIETVKTPILDAQGSVIGTTGIARDITERKQAGTTIRNVTRLYSFLSQINQAIVRIRDRDQLFRTICEVAVEFGQFRMAWIGLVDESSGAVKPLTHAGHEDGYLENVVVTTGSSPTGMGPTGSALREGSIVTCDDLATDPRMVPWREQALKRGYRSSAAVPLRARGAVIGALNLYAAEPGCFPDEERKLLEEIGVDISFALDALETERERRRAEEDLRHRSQGLATLLEVSRSLAATLDLEDVLQATTDGVTKLFGLDTAAVYLLKAETLLLSATTPPLPPQFPDELRRAKLADHPRIREAISSGLPVFLPDTAGAALSPAERAVTELRNLRTIVFLPLIAGVKPMGALIVGAVGEPRTLSEAEIDLCRTLANLAALAVENALLYRTGQRHAADLEQRFVERRRAEEVVRKSEQLLAESQRIAHIGTWDVEVATGRVTWSDEMYRIYGVSPDSFGPTAESFLRLVHADDLAAMRAWITAVQAGEKPPDLEFRILRPDGRTRYIHGRGDLQQGADHRSRLLGTAQDVTERMKAEQERLELERRLLHAQKLESLGVLAGGIAHDFNNLLMAILGNLDLALKKLSPVSPARANIDQSARAARRATDLTRQLLAYSGKGKFVVKAMDLSELVEENTHLLRASVAKTATLDLRLGRALPPIEGDAGQVQQVIMNLITNASEAIGDQSGVIAVSTGAQDWDADSLRRNRSDEAPPAGRFVSLTVSDTGCGMDAQTQQRLFDPFFSTKAPGRGLGMSAILGIVRGHRGAVLVDSAVSKGTTIRILFPALEGAQALKDAAADAAAAAAWAPLRGGTVLVVDDEEIVRNVCQEMVEALGLRVLAAADGREAVEVFRRHADAISHVILDLSMPNMDGMTAFKELARIRPGVKVILSSGHSEQDAIHRLSGQGPAGFIQKPYTLKNLRDALEKAV